MPVLHASANSTAHKLVLNPAARADCSLTCEKASVKPVRVAISRMISGKSTPGYRHWYPKVPTASADFLREGAVVVVRYPCLRLERDALHYAGCHQIHLEVLHQLRPNPQHRHPLGNFLIPVIGDDNQLSR